MATKQSRPALWQSSPGKPADATLTSDGGQWSLRYHDVSVDARRRRDLRIDEVGPGRRVGRSQPEQEPERSAARQAILLKHRMNDLGGSPRMMARSCPPSRSLRPTACTGTAAARSCCGPDGDGRMSTVSDRRPSVTSVGSSPPRHQRPSGPLRVAGVVIPYRGSNVAHGSRDRTSWEDHRRYLAALQGIVDNRTLPMVVAGDFNQRHPFAPAYLVPEELHTQMLRSLGDLAMATGGNVPGIDAPLIDPVALSPGLRDGEVRAWPAAQDGIEVSDHPGFRLDLQL